MRRAPRPLAPAKRWLTFLRNHREAIAAMDFFTVPTLTFGILYCFFVIGHDRHRILHFNATHNPNALWVTLQLHETWEYGQQSQRFLIFDRDSQFGAEVVSTVKAIGPQPLRTTFRSPWQNGIVERWFGSVRRDLLNHVIAPNRRHLRRLLKEYVRYYHEEQTHLGLGEGYARWSSSIINALESPQSHLVAATRWVASPLYSRGLTAFHYELEFAVSIRGRFTPGSR